MAEVLIEGALVLGQDYVGAGSSAGRLRTEGNCAAEGQLVAGLTCALEERHAEEQNLAAELRIVVVDTGAVRVGTGSYYELVEAAVYTVALAGLLEIVEMVELLVGLVELADTVAWVGLAVLADKDMLGTADYADTVAKDNLVVVADTDAAVPDIVGPADAAAGVVGTVGLVHTVAVVDSAEVAAGIADVVAATEWQPSLTAMTPDSCFCRLQKMEKGICLRSRTRPSRLEILMGVGLKLTTKALLGKSLTSLTHDLLFSEKGRKPIANET